MIHIRRDRDFYLVYFADTQHVLETNQMGSIILDLLFNQGMEVNDIVKKIATEYSVAMTQACSDIATFLKHVCQSLDLKGYKMIEDRQLDAPIGAELEITTSCNLRCKHCLQGSYDEVFMPLEKICHIIKILSDNGVFEINLIGGEPFKHKKLLEVLEYCEQKELVVNVITNGMLLNEVIISKLSLFKHLFVSVSLDGIGETHDYIRGKGSFRKVKLNLLQLCEKGVAVGVLCTLNAINMRKYEEVIHFCSSLGISCNFNLFKPFKPEHSTLTPTPEVFFETIIELFNLRRSRGYNIGLSNASITSELLGAPSRNECKATGSGVVINVDGRMVTCPSLVFSGYYEESELPLFDENYVETWRKHQIFQNFRGNGLNECQARSHIFNNDVCGFDPYGITAFRKYRKTLKNTNLNKFV